MIPIVTWFNKGDDGMISSAPLKNVTLNHLQELFDVESDNPMYDAYPVETSVQIKFVEDNLQQSLNLDLYEYFVEYSD
jgi:hypothetical protein